MSVLEIAYLREVAFFVLASNLLLKLHIWTQTMEQDLPKEVSQIRNLLGIWFTSGLK